MVLWPLPATRSQYLGLRALGGGGASGAEDETQGLLPADALSFGPLLALGSVFHLLSPLGKLGQGSSDGRFSVGGEGMSCSTCLLLSRMLLGLGTAVHSAFSGPDALAISFNPRRLRGGVGKIPPPPPRVSFPNPMAEGSAWAGWLMSGGF